MNFMCVMLAAVALATGDMPKGTKIVRGRATTPDGKYTYVVHSIGRNWLPVTQVDRGWCHNAAISAFDAKTGKFLNTVLLDDPDLGAAEPWDVVVSAKEIIVAHSGSSEISYIDRAAFERKLEAAGGKDLSTDMSFMAGIRRREKTPKQGPRKLQLLPDGKVKVTEYLEDRPGITKGELYFNDARLCFQQWQSCGTCHIDGRTDDMEWSFPRPYGFNQLEMTCDFGLLDIEPKRLEERMFKSAGPALFAEVDRAKTAEMGNYVRMIMDRGVRERAAKGGQKKK